MLQIWWPTDGVIVQYLTHFIFKIQLEFHSEVSDPDKREEFILNY